MAHRSLGWSALRFRAFLVHSFARVCCPVGRKVRREPPPFGTGVLVDAGCVALAISQPVRSMCMRNPFKRQQKEPGGYTGIVNLDELKPECTLGSLNIPKRQISR